jgi:hypothetical protein
MPLVALAMAFSTFASIAVAIPVMPVLTITFSITITMLAIIAIPPIRRLGTRERNLPPTLLRAPSRLSLLALLLRERCGAVYRYFFGQARTRKPSARGERRCAFVQRHEVYLCMSACERRERAHEFRVDVRIGEGRRLRERGVDVLSLPLDAEELGYFGL